MATNIVPPKAKPEPLRAGPGGTHIVPPKRPPERDPYLGNTQHSGPASFNQPGSTSAQILGQLAPLSADQRNAYTSLQTMLEQYGLQTLAPQILGFVKAGYTGNSLSYLLSQTPEYKQRFAGNDARIKAGLAPLTPAEYLATERSYRDVLRSSGLPSGFYDQPSDFQSLISSDISPTELQARAQDAFNFAQNGVDPNVKSAFQQYYGVGDGHLAAYFLDPKNAEALIQRQVNAAQIGGAAKAAGVNVDQQHAEQYVNQGVTYAQAQSGATQAGLIKTDVENAAQRFNTPFSDSDLADATIGGLASAQRAQRQLASSEAGLFGGSAGAIQQLGSNPGGAY